MAQQNKKSVLIVWAASWTGRLPLAGSWMLEQWSMMTVMGIDDLNLRRETQTKKRGIRKTTLPKSWALFMIGATEIGEKP